MSNEMNLNKFALSLYKKLTEPNGNVFVSPYSISMALSMCYVGAKESTQSQMKQVLGFGESLTDDDVLKMNQQLLAEMNLIGKDESGVKLNVANKIYPMTGFDIKKDYVDSLLKHFSTEVHQLDFAKASEAAKTINGWVESQTNEKIKDLISADSLNSLTRLVLVNAIYFKGNWMNQFKKEMTLKDDFFLADKSTKKVDMMRLNKKFAYLEQGTIEGLQAEVLEIPYVGERVAMTIILPDGGVALEKVEESLSSELLTLVFKELSIVGANQSVNLSLPKFKLEYSTELSGHLKKLGASDAFDQSKANFKGISDIASGLYISQVVHKSFIDVNEEGTEAAAATGVVMMTRCMPLPPVDFNCNRPFLFFINDRKNGTVLFMGKYIKPE